MISPNELRALALVMSECNIGKLKHGSLEIQVWSPMPEPAKPLTAEEEKAARAARAAYDEALQYAHVEGLPRS